MILLMAIMAPLAWVKVPRIKAIDPSEKYKLRILIKILPHMVMLGLL